MITSLSICHLRISVEKVRWKNSLEIMTLNNGVGYDVLVLAKCMDKFVWMNGYNLKEDSN